MLVYTSAKLSNYFLGAVSSRFCATYFKIQQMHNYIIMEIHWFTVIFHIDYNAPCLPPKFCINIFFNIQYFSWDDCNIQQKLKTKCKIFGVNKVQLNYGLCENGEYIVTLMASLGVIKKRVYAIRKLKWTNP